MMLVDDRAGSAELAPVLERAGLPVGLTRLDFGDLAFVGRGDHDDAIDVGIEFKTLNECVQAMRTGRLARQCRGMRSIYEVRFLMIEGELIYDKQGRLLRRTSRREFKPMPGKMGVGEFMKRVFVQHACNGITPLFPRTQRDAIKMLDILYRTWTDQSLDEHQSHLALYQPPTLIPISDFREAIMHWPNIGQKLSLAAEQYFGGSIRRAVLASEDEWASLVTLDKQGHPRRFGHKSAAELRRFFK